MCRDLWLLHVSSLERGPPSEPWRRTYLGEEPGDTDSEDDSSNYSLHKKGKEKGERQGSDAKDYESDEESSDGIDALLEELSSSSSSPDESPQLPSDQHVEPQKTDLGSSESKKFNAKKRRKRYASDKNHVRLQEFEKPAMNITLLWVGCWILRIPVMGRDFIK